MDTCDPSSYVQRCRAARDSSAHDGARLMTALGLGGFSGVSERYARNGAAGQYSPAQDVHRHVAARAPEAQRGSALGPHFAECTPLSRCTQ